MQSTGLEPELDLGDRLFTGFLTFKFRGNQKGNHDIFT